MFETVILPKKNLYICNGENEAGVICDFFLIFRVFSFLVLMFKISGFS